MKKRYLNIFAGIILAIAAFAAAGKFAHEPTYEPTYEPPAATVTPTAAAEPETTPDAAESPTPTPEPEKTPEPTTAVTPAPTAMPEAAEPPAELTCTLSVSCSTILDNLDKLNPEKRDLVPPGGVIYAERRVTFNEGESVFNLLRREMRKNGIHMEFVNTPMYQSAYIEGIANLYEFDCGELSGWMYRVNGEFPNFGCSRYILKDGDRVEWVYTCDLGKDVGGPQGDAAYE